MKEQFSRTAAVLGEDAVECLRDPDRQGQRDRLVQKRHSVLAQVFHCHVGDPLCDHSAAWLLHRLDSCTFVNVCSFVCLDDILLAVQ